jgi:hypothetical protein
MSLGNPFLSVGKRSLAAAQPAVALKLILVSRLFYARSNHSYSFVQVPNARCACLH